jgi:DNA-binding transcriptional LysR family regulator
MALVTQPGHRLARIRKLTLDQLQNEAFVTFDPSLSIRKEIDRYLRRQGIKVDILMEFDNIETIKQAVEIGAGVSFLPVPTVQAEVERGSLAIAPLAMRDLRRPLGIVHRARQTFTPSVARFVDLLRKNQPEAPELNP